MSNHIEENRAHYLYLLEGDVDVVNSIDRFTRSILDEARERILSFNAQIQNDTIQYAEERKLFPSVVREIWTKHFRNTQCVIPTEPLCFFVAQRVREARKQKVEITSKWSSLEKRIRAFLFTFDEIEFNDLENCWTLKAETNDP